MNNEYKKAHLNHLKQTSTSSLFDIWHSTLSTLIASLLQSNITTTNFKNLSFSTPTEYGTFHSIVNEWSPNKCKGRRAQKHVDMMTDSSKLRALEVHTSNLHSKDVGGILISQIQVTIPRSHQKTSAYNFLDARKQVTKHYFKEIYINRYLTWDKPKF